MFHRYRIGGRAVGLLLGVAFLLLASMEARASSSRFWLAAQYDWGKKQGFYIAFENEAPGRARPPLKTLKLILGVGDGKSWQFVSPKPAWELDREYQVKAVLSPTGSELWLDGVSVGRLPGTCVPGTGPVQACHTPDYAKDPAEYIIEQASLTLSDGSTRVEAPISGGAARHPGIVVFEPQAPVNAKWQMDPARTLTIETRFRILAVPDLRALAPLIDRYGQARYAEWPGKVKSDADLVRAAQEEARRLRAWSAPEGYDRFGGTTRAGWKEKATGFYRVTRRNGYWWLVSPEGNPCFYVGVGTAPALTWDQTPVTGREFLFEWLPPKEAPYGPAWGKNPWGKEPNTEYVAFHTANMVRKYGPEWEERAKEVTANRLKVWGFSGMGKWGGMEGQPTLPVLRRSGVPNVVRHPDVFDPAVRAALREALRKQIEPRRKAPLVIGWSVGNEYDEIIAAKDIPQVLQKPATLPLKRALVEHTLEKSYGGDVARMAAAWGAGAKTIEELLNATVKPPTEDVERMRRFYMDRYHEFLYRTVKELDPDHLYFSGWIVPGWWENEEDWRIIARHCDVVGYDRYAEQFVDERLTRLFKESDKPVLCGEFSYPGWYDGQRGYGLYGVWGKDDADCGDRYRRWVEDAADNPYCVGVMWFQYRDQPFTGRGPGGGDVRAALGEHFAFGLVDITDAPKWDLVSRVRDANRAAAGRRLAATKAGAR